MDTQPITLTPELVQQLLPPRSDEEWQSLREAFLAKGYRPCSACDPGRARLVSPAFIRQIDGLGVVALCPDRANRHAARLGPARLAALLKAFAQAEPVAQADEPEPETSADPQVVDFDAKRNGRKA